MKYKKEFNNNINKKKEKLIPPINEIKNEIDCVYVPNYREENEIALLHDYNLNKDQIPVGSTNIIDLYTKNKNILPIFFKQYTEIFIDNIQYDFSFKYKVKKSEKIIVKFKFKKVLNDISFMFCNCRSLIYIDLNNFLIFIQMNQLIYVELLHQIYLLSIKQKLKILQVYLILVILLKRKIVK